MADRGALAKAIEDLAHDPSESNRERVFDILRDCSLLVVTLDSIGSVDSGTANIRKGQLLRLLNVDNDSGRALAAAFTDLETIRLFSVPDGARWIELPSKVLFQMVLGAGSDGLVIDPGGPVPLPIPPDILQGLAKPQPRLPRATDTPINVRAPRFRPDRTWIERAGAAIRRHPELLAGYLVQWEGAGAAEHVVLLRFSQRELESKTLDVVDAVRSAIDRNLGNGERVDVIAIDDANLMTLARQRGVALY